MKKLHFAKRIVWQAARILDAEQALASPASAEREEAVHTLRLALRALRVLLLFFRGQPLLDAVRRQLAECYRLSGKARELEVALGLLPSLPACHPRARARIVRQWTCALLCERGLLCLSLQQTLQPALAILLALVAEADAAADKRRQRKRVARHARHLHKRLQRCLRRALNSGHVTHWHAARLAIKRYRFWCEQFMAVMGLRTRRRVETLHRLQVLLGEFNDLENLRQRLAEARTVYQAWHCAIEQRQSRLQRVVRRRARRSV